MRAGRVQQTRQAELDPTLKDDVLFLLPRCHPSRELLLKKTKQFLHEHQFFFWI